MADSNLTLAPGCLSFVFDAKNSNFKEFLCQKSGKQSLFVSSRPISKKKVTFFPSSTKTTTTPIIVKRKDPTDTFECSSATFKLEKCPTFDRISLQHYTEVHTHMYGDFAQPRQFYERDLNEIS